MSLPTASLTRALNCFTRQKRPDSLTRLFNPIYPRGRWAIPGPELVSALHHNAGGPSVAAMVTGRDAVDEAQGHHTQAQVPAAACGEPAAHFEPESSRRLETVSGQSSSWEGSYSPRRPRTKGGPRLRFDGCFKVGFHKLAAAAGSAKQRARL